MQNPPTHKKLFHPASPEELLRGWMLHAHKGRDRHDEAARRLDRFHQGLGILTALFSAIAGSSFFAAQGSAAPDRLTGYVAGVIGFVAAVLASIQTASNFAGRAEAHRVAGVRYKSVIRKLELLICELPKLGVQSGSRLEAALPGIETELNDLESKSPVVPPRIYKHVNQQYEGVSFADTVDLLNKPLPA